MKGIVLAGGTGSRLWPITISVSKQLLPVYNKPMIYYPISTLMLAGVREILIITTPQDQAMFIHLLGDGHQFGLEITYAVQDKPEGIAQAFIIAENFLKEQSCLLILGDNIFHGAGLGTQLRNTLAKSGAHIFTYEVSNPSQYGVLNVDETGTPISIEEKPKQPKSRLAVTGLYFFDSKVAEIARRVQPSLRNELEITSVIDAYISRGEIQVTHLSRGIAWLDTGNPNALHDATTYVRLIEERTGQKIACLEEIALSNNWISIKEYDDLIKTYGNSFYLKKSE
jgi:glucose-1-phosphate thymidylyltransferase